MKKSFYFAAMAVVALFSCSSDDVVVRNDSPINPEDNGLVPILMSVGTPSMSVVTRGTGTVGNILDGSSAWHGERVRVLMTQLPGANASDPNNAVFTYTYRIDGDPATKTNLFDNTFYCLPTVEDEQIRLLPKGVDTRYYPSTGSSNFFAYYIDDAVNEENGLEETVNDGDIAAETKDVPAEESEDGIAYKYVDFELDGTQDVMAGMAAPPADPRYPGFSAEAARHNVHPTVQMNHLLTRFTFSVVAGNANADGVSVDQITVKSSAKGKLKVAYDVDKEWYAANAETYMNDLIDWSPSDEEDLADFILKERAIDGEDNYIYLDGENEKTPLQDLTPYEIDVPNDYIYTARTQATRLGDAIFVRPNQPSYQLTVTTSYTDHPELSSEPIVKNIEVRGAQDQLIEFEQGKSYHVTIVVYGLSEIKVFAELTPWQDGGDVPRINEDLFETDAFTANTLEHIYTAKLNKFEVTDEEKVTYDNEETFAFTTTADEELGVKILATDADAVKGKELRVSFAEAAQVKVVVKYFDDTEVEMTMDEAAEILYMAIDSTKWVKEIQILTTEAGTVTLTEVVINPESTEPEEAPEP